MEDYSFSFSKLFVGLGGQKVQRTYTEYPYSFDPYCTWAKDWSNVEPDNCEYVYSDRLKQWDYKEYENACQQAFGNTGDIFSGRQPKDIEKFLSLFLEQEIELHSIFNGANISSGYPYWVFVFTVK